MIPVPAEVVKNTNNAVEKIINKKSLHVSVGISYYVLKFFYYTPYLLMAAWF